VVRSTRNTVESSVESAKVSTSVQRAQPAPVATSTTTGGPPATTGARASEKTWPGTPSESPRTSSTTVSACTASTVPPMVKALADRTIGDAL
jgi:hypothetical protein